MALVNISSQIKQIENELKLLGRIKYKLNSQMRHFKEMHMLRMINSRVKKFVKQSNKLTAYDVKSIDLFTLTDEILTLQSVLSLITNTGKLIKDFIQDGFLLQFSVMSFGICAKLYTLLQKILKKIKIVDKIQIQRKLKLKKKGISVQQDS